MKLWVVYPERKDKAPVVMVISEIFGLSDWIRGVADQLAKDGFIAIAPDFISGMGPNGGGTDAVASRDEVVKLIRAVTPDDQVAVLNATRDYALKLPAANGKIATVGYCWGGSASFNYATAQPALNAAAVFYGSSPDAAKLATDQGAGDGLLRRQRRARERHDPAGRSRDEEAREGLHAAHLRRCRARLPPPAERRRRAPT